MHAASDPVRCRTAQNRRFEFHTLDAAVIAFGDRSPLNFVLQMPDFAAGGAYKPFQQLLGTSIRSGAALMVPTIALAFSSKCGTHGEEVGKRQHGTI